MQRFISRLPPSPKQTPEKEKAYKQQIRSRLKRLVKAAIGGKKSGDNGLSPLLKNIPDFMLPVLLKLPKEGGRLAPRIEVQSESDLRQLLAIITDRGRDLLTALLGVVERHKLTTVESLLSEHSLDVLKELRRIYTLREAGLLHNTFTELRKRLGVPRAPASKVCLDMGQWPPTIRKQTELFFERSVSGLDTDRTLGPAAASHKINIKKLAVTTRAGYVRAIAYALPHIPYKGDLNVVDLLTLKSVKRQVRPEPGRRGNDNRGCGRGTQTPLP